MLVTAGDHRDLVRETAKQFASNFAALGGQVSIQHGDVREGDERGHEHFGFDDGVSQPGIRGRASNAADDFVTDRKLDPADIPDAWLYGYPGQTLVWPGELRPRLSVIQSRSAHSRAHDAVRRWLRNGSFLVYRRLRQDVAAFWTTMRAEAARLSKQPGFEGMDDVRLASLLVGRWPSGPPSVARRKPTIQDLGDDAMANNDFLFDNDTPQRQRLRKKHTCFPVPAADPCASFAGRISSSARSMCATQHPTLAELCDADAAAVEGRRDIRRKPRRQVRREGT